MRKLTALELLRMRAIQVDSMNDIVNITNYVITTDSYGDEIKTPTIVSGVSCGISWKGGSKSEAPGQEQVDYDAVIRFPLTASLDINSKITVLTVDGTSINKTLKPISFPELGSTAQIVKVKRVSN